jgi:hypothetical protein
MNTSNIPSVVPALKAIVEKSDLGYHACMRPTIAVVSCDSPEMVEAMVQIASAKCGIGMDWWYVGGRACIHAYGNEDEARRALYSIMPHKSNLTQAVFESKAVKQSGWYVEDHCAGSMSDAFVMRSKSRKVHVEDLSDGRRNYQFAGTVTPVPETMRTAIDAAILRFMGEMGVHIRPDLDPFKGHTADSTTAATPNPSTLSVH